MSQAISQRQGRRDLASHIAGYVLCALAATILLGWLSPLPPLAGRVASLAAPGPVSAFCILFAGASLAAEDRLPARIVARLGWLVWGIGALALALDLLRIDVGFAGWLVPGGPVPDATARFGTAPATGIGFVAGGAALALRADERLRTVALTLAALSALIAATALADIPRFGAIPLPTGLALLVMNGAVLIRRDLAWPRLTLTMVLGALVLSALLPPLVFIASQARRSTQQRLAQLERDSHDFAGRIGDIVERRLAERAALLRALAVAPALKAGDLAAFYAHAKAALDPAEGVVVITDVSSSPRIVLSTAVPYGAPLPEPNEPDARRQAMASGQVELSDVFKSPFTGGPVASLLMLAPGTNYVVRISIRTQWFNEQFAAITPSGWILAVADRDGVLAGRSRDPDKWVGRRGSTAAWALASRNDKGWTRSTVVEGTPVFFAWQRLPSGWTALTAVNESDFDLVAHRQTATISIAALVMGVLGLLFATLTAVAIGRPLARLSAAATAFGRGAEIPPITSHIREIDDVITALRTGAKARAAAETALRAREEDSRHFTYAASHDLKAPTSTLQMVFSQMQTRLGAGDIKTAHELARLGLGSVVRMRELLGKVLEYSRVVDKERIREELDLRTLIVDEVLADLNQQVIESGAQVSVGELPVIYGDRVHFRALFQNLLANAMKYGKPGVAPTVSVLASQTRAADTLSISVKDNGMGIPSQFHARIFEMFQRLHTQNVAGTGLGLFLCMRIIRFYGGNIRVVSAPEQGAEFIVELPQAMRAQ
jgi:signal transduction histidine kinase